MNARANADVCLILEGTYPYVPGGVAAWTHDLISKQSHLAFHLVCILPRDEKLKMHYELPKNVVSLTNLHIQHLPTVAALSKTRAALLMEALKDPLVTMTTGKASQEDFRRILKTLSDYGPLSAETLMDSHEAWDLLTNMYETSFAESSFLDYFWSWRALMGGLYSIAMAQIPQAKIYHALSTGYAGLMASRCAIETGKPAMVTEHGIYTNERRIEISSADWLEETASKSLTIDRTRLNLRDMWIDTFTNYSRICYETCDPIITLFSGNQPAQLADGANPASMRIIPNGIDVERYGAIRRREHDRPTVALIGRVVPIKDIKGFLRAMSMLRDQMPDIKVLIMGPMDEDPDYAHECTNLCEYLALKDTVTFTGKVRIDEYLPDIDVVAFSSLSEAQPLTILEAGACGIPVVATNVGACKEMVLGSDEENPQMGPGGVIVPLANPQALAEGCLQLLRDREFYNQCSAAMRTRVATYYNKDEQHSAYQSLYASLG
ncbi:MAG: GT4 family glycosyltransferase PelF [Alphaproteobacteria bacterium]